MITSFGIRYLLLFASLSMFTACGGGGSSSSGSSSATSSSSGVLISRDTNGDILIGDANFVYTSEISDWLFGVQAYPENFNFHLYIPETYSLSASNEYPIVIKLHGDDGHKETLPTLGLWSLVNGPLKSLVGSDGRLNSAGRPLLNAHIRDAFVVIPEVPHIDRSGYWFEPLGYWNPNALNKIVSHLQQKYRIDQKRIYVTGLSFGGFGTWHYANTNAHKIAAIVPICGPYPLAIKPELKTLPIWMFQSYDDPTVTLKGQVLPLMDSLIEPLRFWATFPNNDRDPVNDYTVSYNSQTGLEPWVMGDNFVNGKINMTIYAKGGHDAWTRAYNNNAMWDWLFSQSK